jgi:peptidoglycan hydrolase-like protein with peptidoglycan-binding domain
MRCGMRRSLLILAVYLCAAAPSGAATMGNPSVAALQVALIQQGLYEGPVDGANGPATTAAVRGFQKRARLVPDGVAGQQTRAALGLRGGPTLGSRPMGFGMTGWDVAGLQFLLAWHGFPSGDFDGIFGYRTEAALLRFQRWAGLPPVGRAGSQTVAALREPLPASPLQLGWPLAAPVSDPFGPRGRRFHSGIDLPEATGAVVTAARAGRVTYADWLDGGWGIEVTIAHGSGVRTIYAHLSRALVAVGQHVEAGQSIGRVGATGHASGPHLHFEVRLRGAAVDPLPALAPRVGAE